MSNNKQISVEWLVNSLIKLGYLHSNGFGQSLKVTEVIKQAKQQHKKESIVFALLCMMPNMEPDKSTIEVVSDIYDKVFNK